MRIPRPVTAAAGQRAKETHGICGCSNIHALLRSKDHCFVWPHDTHLRINIHAG